MSGEYTGTEQNRVERNAELKVSNFWVLFGAAIGAVLGLIAYVQHWL